MPVIHYNLGLCDLYPPKYDFFVLVWLISIRLYIYHSAFFHWFRTIIEFPNASEATMKHIGKKLIWIHKEYDETKA